MMKSLLLLLSLLVSACGGGPAAPTATLPPPIVTIISATGTPTRTPLPTPTLTTESAIRPYTIEGLRGHDFEGGKIRMLETSLETDIFTRYLIDYPSDGLVISGVLQVPKMGTQPFPVIVMNHGFFSRTVYSSGDGTDRAAEFLNRRGYLTISSDYRSWAKSESGDSLFYSGLAIDVVNLMNALPSIPQADPARVGMWGHSMGGGVTLKVLAIDPEARIKAAVLYSTVSGDFKDIIERWGPGCLGDVLQGETTFGCNSSDILSLDSPPDLISAYFDSVDDRSILQAVSPIDHLDLVSAPVQINYGTKDGLVSSGTPPEWSKKLYQAFKDAGKQAALFGYEGETHSFKADQWFAFMERSAQFFDKYVRP